MLLCLSAWSSNIYTPMHVYSTTELNINLTQQHNIFYDRLNHRITGQGEKIINSYEKP